MNHERLAQQLPLDRLSTWAIIGAVGGLLAEITFLPSALKGLFLCAFIFLGPGSAVLEWFPELPKYAVRALISTLR